MKKVINILIIENDDRIAEVLKEFCLKAYSAGSLTVNVTISSHVSTSKRLLKNNTYEAIMWNIYLNDGASYSLFEAFKIKKPVILLFREEGNLETLLDYGLTSSEVPILLLKKGHKETEDGKTMVKILIDRACEQMASK
ncbi:MAG TPA: hypothetical protein PKZ56_02000 [Candidatus Paceibacterota bacterium]|nr:hypothetical protein [Candidatus Paceibacterota bacterium]